MDRIFVEAQLTENLGFTPTGAQQKLLAALCDFLLSGDCTELMLIKGYAGTGKTSVLNSLVRTLSAMGKKSVLLAPTGRAAKVLSAYTGRSAWTMHKKIYRQKSGSDGLGEFVLDRNSHRDTWFIVDEASMIGGAGKDSAFGSGDLLMDLLHYIEAGQNCRLVLAGDTAQLPPVGLSLSPALDSGHLQALGYRIREVELTEVVRQLADSGILHNATAIRTLITRGEAGLPLFDFSSFSDISLLSGEDLIETLESCYDKYGSDETIVLTRSNKRAYRFNMGIRGQILWREEELCTGDLLMVVKNNYFWKDDQKKIDFIANGDILKVERLIRIEEVYGYRFATATVSFPDYHDLEMEVRLLLNVIELEGPSLGREAQKELFRAIAEDYPEAGNRRQLSQKLAEDPYFNALQVKYAYALTCHKAQGGQWKAVFFDQAHFSRDMLDTAYLRWLYTAFTRASEKLYLLNFSPDFIPQ